MNNSGESEAITERILELEAARCAAVMAADITALSELVDDDLIHIHVTAMKNDRTAYLNGIRSRTEYKSVTREDLNVRVYGDVVIVTGMLINIHRLQNTNAQWLRTKALVSQVWHKRTNGWKQVTFHATLVERSEVS